MSKPIWPKIPAPFVRAMLAGHSALGLAFAALIYLVCLSGALAVFIEEFQRWERPADPVVREVSPAIIQRAFLTGLAQGPKTDHVILNLPAEGLPRLTARTDGPEGDKAWALNADASLAGESATPWTEFVTSLHIYLHLPRTWGIFVVGLTGVALLSSLVSGVLSHPRVFKDAFHLRWGGSKRLQEADLHNRIGVWALPFHITLSLTGSLLGLSTVIVGILALVVFKGDVNKAYALFLAPEPTKDIHAAPPPDLTQRLAFIAGRSPDSKPDYVVVEEPRRADQHISIGVTRPGRLARETYGFNRQGELLGGSAYGARNFGETLFTAIGPVHFGWFGGWPIKLAYGILGVGLATVTSSGVAIWLARRRTKGRPAPRWERIWIATVWSQPVAYALTALAVIGPGLPGVPVWLGVTLAAFVPTLFGSPAQISAWLRMAAAAALTVLAVSHWAIWRSSASIDPAAWVVDGALVALALVLVAPSLIALRAQRIAEPLTT